jgi:hypothetical protein
MERQGNSMMATIQNTVHSARFVAAAPPADASGASPPAPGAIDLLPECGDMDGAQLGDAMTTLFALELRGQQSDQASGLTQVESDRQRASEALQQQLQALERQHHDSGGPGFFSCIGKLLKDITVDATEFDFKKLVADVRTDGAACDNPQFWSDLEVGAKIVAAIAAVAATVVSCGTLGPVVVGIAIALSCAGFAVQQTHCLGKASVWVGLGCQLAAAAVTCGASLSASAATVGTAAVDAASAAATATSGTATVVAGAAHVEATGFQADAARAQADAVQAQNDARFDRQLEQWAVDTLGEQVAAHRDAMTALSGAIHTNQQASLVAAAALTRG